MKRLMIDEFEFDIDKVNKKIKEYNAKKILLQVPDGLKRNVKKIIESLDGDVDLWGGSNYGACDLPSSIDGYDILVHVGHSKIPNLDIDYPVIYMEGRSTELKDLPEELFDLLGNCVALYASVQYIDHLEKISETLDEKGFDVKIGEGDDRIKYPGQVLGCNYSVKEENADSHLYIGTGDFHPLGLSLSLNKNVIKFNPLTGDISQTGEKKERILRKRFAVITNAEECSNIGIMVSTKVGQNRIELAKSLSEKCSKKCKIALFDEIDSNLIDDFQWDCIVNTACPRIALDDSIKFKTRVLTPVEFLITIGELNWENWEMDEIS